MNDAPTARPAIRGISDRLRRFTEELPRERRPILEFVSELALRTPPNACVLDLGAGEAPYRELFEHTRYVTNDWSQSPHAGARNVDIVASAEAVPLPSDSQDLILCTQVLEHVPNPGAVLAECHRLLRSGGTVGLTVPLIWELHELPHDYYRYTENGLRHLLDAAGFDGVDVIPRSDAFSAIAQLLENVGWAMGDADDGLTAYRVQARETLRNAALEVEKLAPLDVQLIMPLGYSATGRKP